MEKSELIRLLEKECLESLSHPPNATLRRLIQEFNEHHDVEIEEKDLKRPDNEEQLIIDKVLAKRNLKPDLDKRKKIIKEAWDVLNECTTLTPLEKVMAVEELIESIVFEEPKDEPTRELRGCIDLPKPNSLPTEDLRPILVKIVVKPKDNHIYYEPRDIVSKAVKRNQQIVYWCEYPFTIYFGGNSIITDLPFAPAKSIQAWLQSKPTDNGFHIIDNAWIWMNALSGKYKYFVAVAVTILKKQNDKVIQEVKVIVDDPEDVVRDPDEEP